MRIFRLVTAILTALLIFLAGPWAMAAQPAAVKIELEHLVYTLNGDELNVKEILTASNPSDKKVEVKYSLPAGYYDLKVQGLSDEMELVKDKTSFTDKAGIDPGQKKDVVFEYKVKWSGEYLTLTKETYYETAALDILTAPGLAAQADEFVDGGDLAMGSKVFHYYHREKVTAGTPVKITLSKAPITSIPPQGTTSPSTPTVPAASTSSEPFLYLVVAAAVIIIIGAFYLLGRRQGGLAPTGGAGGKSRLGTLAEERERLIDALAELDLAHEHGEIAEEEYRTEREALKERLVEITLQLRG